MGILESNVKKIGGFQGDGIARYDAAESLPIVLSTEDLAKLEAIRALLAASIPAGTTNIGDVDIVSTGATDDAAAAGAIFPVAGIYQAVGSVDKVDAGDVARTRITERRAFVMGHDFSIPRVSGSSISNATDMDVSTAGRQSGYAAISNVSDVTWAASSQTRWYRVPIGLQGFKSCDLVLTNLLGVDATFSIYSWIVGGVWATDQAILWSQVRPTGGGISVLQAPGGAGNASMDYCEALGKMNASYIVVEVVPSASATGTIQLVFARGT
jgi:hypothetical protein